MEFSSRTGLKLGGVTELLPGTTLDVMDQALDDVAETLGFTDLDVYLVALGRERRKILKRLKT